MREIYLATSGYGVLIHDPITYDVLCSYLPTNAHEIRRPVDISWSVDRKNLAVLTGNGPVEIMHWKDENLFQTSTACVETSQEQFAEVLQVCSNSLDSQIASTVSTGQILVYSYSNTSVVQMSLHFPNSKVSALSFQQDGKKSLLAGGSNAGLLSCWSTLSGKEVYTAPTCHTDSINDIAFSKVRPNLLASVSTDRDLCIHDIDVGPKAAIRVPTEHALTSVDLCPDGNVVALGTATGHLLSYDLRSYSRPLFTKKLHERAVQRVRYSRHPGKEANGTQSSSGLSQVSPAASGPTSRSTSNGHTQQLSRNELETTLELFSPVGGAKSVVRDATPSFSYQSLFANDTSISPDKTDVKPSLSTLQENSSTPLTFRQKLEPASPNTPFEAIGESNCRFDESDLTNSLFSPLCPTRPVHQRVENISVGTVRLAPASVTHEENKTKTFADGSNYTNSLFSPLAGLSSKEKISYVSPVQPSADARYEKNDLIDKNGLTEAVRSVVAGMKALEMRVMDLEDNVIEKMNALEARFVMRDVLARQKEESNLELENARLKEENNYLKQLLRKQT